MYGEGAVHAGMTSGAFSWAKDNQDLAALVTSSVQDGDVILIKGSRGARMEVVVNALKAARGGRG